MTTTLAAFLIFAISAALTVVLVVAAARLSASTEAHYRSLRSKLPAEVLDVECIYVGRTWSITYWRVIWRSGGCQIFNSIELRQIIDQESARRKLAETLSAQ